MWDGVVYCLFTGFSEPQYCSEHPKPFSVYPSNTKTAWVCVTDGRLRQKTVNDLPVGRSVEETLRLVRAFQVCKRGPPQVSARLFFVPFNTTVVQQLLAE